MAKGDGSKKPDAAPSSSSGESFLTKPVTESVPSVKWWHVLLGGVAAVGGTIAYKKLHK